jgi:hypothetical protein
MDILPSGTGEGAAGEGHPEGAGCGVGAAAELFDGVEVESLFRRGPEHLEDREVSGDAATLRDLVFAAGGDVVGDLDNAHVEALRAEALGGLTEVEHVAGVVAETQHDTATGLGGAGNPAHLPGRGGREDVAVGDARGEAGADEAGEGRVVAGAAADDNRDTTGGEGVSASDTALYAAE